MSLKTSKEKHKFTINENESEKRKKRGNMSLKINKESMCSQAKEKAENLVEDKQRHEFPDNENESENRNRIKRKMSQKIDIEKYNIFTNEKERKIRMNINNVGEERG